MRPGIGGDAFALHFDAATKEVDAFLGCGRSPAKMTLEVCQPVSNSNAV